jgi:hypothetical protein
MPGISSSRTSLSLVPEHDPTGADTAILGLVALAFEVLDERSLEPGGRVVADADLLDRSLPP